MTHCRGGGKYDTDVICGKCIGNMQILPNFLGLFVMTTTTTMFTWSIAERSSLVHNTCCTDDFLPRLVTEIRVSSI